MFLVGMGISIWLVIGACMELDAGGYLSLLLFFGLGVVVFWVADFYRRKQGRELTALTPEDIGRE